MDKRQLRVYKMKFATIYPYYLKKAERKDRTKNEVNKIIYWLTGHNEKSFKEVLESELTLQDFFNNVPKLNPDRTKIKGKICGVVIEDIKEKTMREIRYLDKLIDELSKGKDIEKLLS